MGEVETYRRISLRISGSITIQGDVKVSFSLPSGDEIVLVHADDEDWLGHPIKGERKAGMPIKPPALRVYPDPKGGWLQSSALPTR